MNRVLVLSVAATLSIGLSIGCSSKKYVRSQTGPTINKVNELDDLTAKTSKDIKDVDARAQQGIQGVNAKADAADQKAQAAGQRADQAQTLASNAANQVQSLANTVANLDNYRPVVETTVHFGFDKSNLTAKAKEALDQLGTEIPNTKNYILVIDGNTDSTGPASYNYDLSRRRADAVVQYVASKYNVPAHKIYLIGLGKDKPATDNKTSKGRAENRRVDVRLMTNTDQNQNTTAASAKPPAQQ
ncbi:MAG TPA: OmpA family protein [Terriglobales bacterium]|nr:OmpA family protein [Terriglobales bacterium]